jgi:hypothetical protein
MADMLTGTARPRWARQLATWAATTCWAMLGYLACPGVVYVITARQATGGGPLWWPAAVSAVGILALTSAGFTACALLPTRFTTPLIAIVVFFAIGFSQEGAKDSHSALGNRAGSPAGPAGTSAVSGTIAVRQPGGYRRGTVRRTPRGAPARLASTEPCRAAGRPDHPVALLRPAVRAAPWRRPVLDRSAGLHAGRHVRVVHGLAPAHARVALAVAG